MKIPKLATKYKDFLQAIASVEVLEGTTYAGKTTIGAFKFVLRVLNSKKKIHVLSGLDLGTIEKNIINPDFGLLYCFGEILEYNPKGKGKETLSHIVVNSMPEKIIYLLGYDDKRRWKKALGGQYGCLYIDEANIAHIGFVEEISIRYDYMMMTLNPDDPGLPIYKQYVNHCRPIKKWEKDTPRELLEMLDEEPREGWVHWYFTFDDNVSTTKKKRKQLLTETAKGTKTYKNKILGLRGRSTGLVFDLKDEHIITEEKALTFKYQYFSIGVDTAYSQASPDMIAFSFNGITRCGKLIVLAEKAINNRNLSNPITPSDIPPLLEAWAEDGRRRFGFARDVFIDNADAGTILECQKYRNNTGCIYTFNKAHKKTKILDRISLQSGWMARGDFLIVDECKEHIKELNLYSWHESKHLPEDRNDHTINACQYAWLPFKALIGVAKGDKER